jgi:UDP-glucose:(glucosyl)LPS alpha-1,2-glucosyltransferase
MTTSGLVAMVLPPTGDAVERLVLALAAHPGAFRPIVLAPQGGAPIHGLAHRRIAPSWLPGRPLRRYAAALTTALHQLRPAVIEVHDCPELAALLGGRFRPVPVLLIVHSDPQARHVARDPAARTFLLAQATRVAALSADLRARMLDGVHPAMRHCTLLPPPDGTPGPAATADALDTLRLDALKAWSRPLHGPI